MIRRLTLYTLATCLFVATPALALPPVWTVRDADSEMVLFGSIHILPPALDWRPPPLDAALKVADDLWLEIPTDPGTRPLLLFLSRRWPACRRIKPWTDCCRALRPPSRALTPAAASNRP